MLGDLKNSYLFMMCAREALSLYTGLMPLKESKKFYVSNYFLNEATDYEILYLLVERDFPEKIYDNIDEQRCVNYINESLINNKNFFEKHRIRTDKIYSLKEWNISSQPSVIKFILDNHLISKQRRLFKDKSILENKVDNREASLSELIMLSAILYGAYRAYRSKQNRLYNKCAKLKGDVKKECTLRSKISSLKTHLNRLRSSLPMCRGTRNPKKSRESIKKKMSKISSQISKLEERLKKYTKPEPENKDIYRRTLRK